MHNQKTAAREPGCVEVLEAADKAYFRARVIDVEGKDCCVKCVNP